MAKSLTLQLRDPLRDTAFTWEAHSKTETARYPCFSPERCTVLRRTALRSPRQHSLSPSRGTRGKSQSTNSETPPGRTRSRGLATTRKPQAAEKGGSCGGGVSLKAQPTNTNRFAPGAPKPPHTTPPPPTSPPRPLAAPRHRSRGPGGPQSHLLAFPRVPHEDVLAGRHGRVAAPLAAQRHEGRVAPGAGHQPEERGRPVPQVLPGEAHGGAAGRAAGGGHRGNPRPG